MMPQVQDGVQPEQQPDTREDIRIPKGNANGFGPDDDFVNIPKRNVGRLGTMVPTTRTPSQARIYRHIYASQCLCIYGHPPCCHQWILQATRAGQFTGSIERGLRHSRKKRKRFLSSRPDHFEENQIGSNGRIKHFMESAVIPPNMIEGRRARCISQSILPIQDGAIPNLKDSNAA